MIHNPACHCGVQQIRRKLQLERLYLLQNALLVTLAINPDPFYLQTAAENADQAKTLQSRYDRLALVRLLVFVGWLAALIVLFSNNFLVGLVVFC